MSNKQDEVLFENDTPEIKAAKKQCKEYDKIKEVNKEQNAANRSAEKKKRLKVIESIQVANIKPDSEGAYHITIDDKEWVFTLDSIPVEVIKMVRTSLVSLDKSAAEMSEKNADNQLVQDYTDGYRNAIGACIEMVDKVLEGLPK